MIIQAKNKAVKSTKLIVPIDGLVEINAIGQVEVSDKCGKMLVEGTNDWEPVKGAGKESEGSDGAEDSDETSGEDDGKSEDETVINGINEMSLEDCVATASEAGYPKKEWEKLAKNTKAAEKLMRAYLVKKYKENIESAAE